MLSILNIFQEKFEAYQEIHDEIVQLRDDVLKWKEESESMPSNILYKDLHSKVPPNSPQESKQHHPDEMREAILKLIQDNNKMESIQEFLDDIKLHSLQDFKKGLSYYALQYDIMLTALCAVVSPNALETRLKESQSLLSQEKHPAVSLFYKHLEFFQNGKHEKLDPDWISSLELQDSNEPVTLELNRIKELGDYLLDKVFGQKTVHDLKARMDEIIHYMKIKDNNYMQEMMYLQEIFAMTSAYLEEHGFPRDLKVVSLLPTLADFKDKEDLIAPLILQSGKSQGRPIVFPIFPSPDFSDLLFQPHFFEHSFSECRKEMDTFWTLERGKMYALFQRFVMSLHGNKGIMKFLSLQSSKDPRAGFILKAL